MYKDLVSQRSIRSALLAGAALTISGTAMAQDAPADGTTLDEKIYVTGSRIAKRDYTSNSPISSVAGDQLQQTGSLTPEQLLNTLPQVVPGLTTTSNNPGAGGAATIDLRGLNRGDTNRTLVLVNGRRAMPSFGTGLVDINTIPVSLIERVEIITGGASAVYGPDAIAGVVNFILKDDFEGVSIDAQFGRSERGDADEVAGSAAVGGNFADDKGNAVIAYDYGYRDEMLKGRREFAKQATDLTSYFPEGSYRADGLNPLNEAALDAYFAAFGAAATNQGPGSALGFNPQGSAVGEQLFTIGGVGSGTSNVYNYQSNPDNVATNFCADFTTPANCDTYSYNFEPPNKLILPLERHTLAGIANYDITPSVNVYAQLNFTNYNAETSLAPTPAPTSAVTADNGSICGANYCVPVTNPFIPTDLAALIATRAGDNPNRVGAGATEDFTIRRRFTEGGARISRYSNDIFQTVVGMKGDLTDTLSFDAYVTIGRLDQLETQLGNVSNSAVSDLLYSPTGGVAECGGFDVFGAGGISGGCMTQISRTTKNSTVIEQEVMEASISGPLFALPAGDAEFALGTDYRSFDFQFTPDELAASGDISGFTAQTPVRGSIDDKEVFGELSLPILSDMSFAEYLGVVLGYRFGLNSQTGSSHTYKAEGDWRIGGGVRARGAYQRAVRSPNVFELFAPTYQDNPALPDPCSIDGPLRNGGAGPAGLATLCQTQRSGMTPAVYATYAQPNSQLTALSGGNPNLREETADTFTVGFVYTSDAESPFLEGLNFSIDYYDIAIEGPIGIDAGAILYSCYGGTFNPANPDCGSITYSGADIYAIYAFLVNTVSLETSGVDFQVNWAFDLEKMDMGADAGNLTFNFLITWLNEFIEQSSPTSAPVDFKGSIGQQIGDVFPEWKWTLGATWDVSDFSLSARVNHVAAMFHNQVLVIPSSTATGTDAYTTLDVFGSWYLTDHLTLRGGVLNATDEPPELYAPNTQAGTDPSTFDIVGRRYFVGANIRY